MSDFPADLPSSAPRHGPATMQDVADAAGVSRVTVSKFFNGGASLKPATRERIEAACLALQYSPDPHAVSLVKGRSNLIGVVLPVISEPYFAAVLQTLEQEAATQGLQLLIQSSANDPAREAAALLALKAMKVAGIIITVVDSMQNAALLDSLAREMRIVHFDTYLTPACHHVLNDNHQSIRLLVEHCLARGRKPAYLGAPHIAFPSRPERLESYLDALRAAGLPPCVVPVAEEEHTWRFEAYAHKYVGQWLAEGSWRAAQIGALVCATDRLALGAMRAMREHGLEPGRDLLVCGHDDLSFSEYLHPALTTARQDVARLGRAAIECLSLPDDYFNARRPYFERRLPAELVIRESA